MPRPSPIVPLALGAARHPWRRREDRTLHLPVGDGLLGRVVDAHGEPMDRRGPLARQRPGVRIAMTDGEAAADLERIAGAIGTTTLGMIRTGHPSLGALAIDGVRPSVKALADGTWKPHKVYYLVVPATPQAGADGLRRRLQARAAHDALARWGLLAGAPA